MNKISKEKLLLAFGDNVKAIRESKGITQVQLAELSGFHRTYISQIERGLRNPNLLNISILTDALNTNVSSLLENVFSDTSAAGDVCESR